MPIVGIWEMYRDQPRHKFLVVDGIEEHKGFCISEYRV